MMIFVSAPGWRSLRAVVMPNVNSQKSEHCREKKLSDNTVNKPITCKM